MATPSGSQRYQEILAFVRTSTVAVAAGRKPDLAGALAAARQLIAGVRRSGALMDQAINFYDPADVCESHAVNVAVFSVRMALDLALSAEEIADTAVAALLHDTGFGKIQPALRRYEDPRVGPIPEDVRMLVARHPRYGYEVLAGRGDRRSRIARIVLQHHERADGSGYPYRLRDQEQMLPAKIVSIADAYETLIHPRDLRDALVPPKGIDAIVRQKGTAFSAPMIKQLIRSLSVYPVGQFVRLNNGMVGKVVKTDPDNPVRPVVAVTVSASGKPMTPPKIVRLAENRLLTVEACLPGYGKKLSAATFGVPASARRPERPRL